MAVYEVVLQVEVDLEDDYKSPDKWGWAAMICCEPEQVAVLHCRKLPEHTDDVLLADPWMQSVRAKDEIARAVNETNNGEIWI